MIASRIDLLSIQLAGSRAEKQTSLLFFCRRFVMLAHRNEALAEHIRSWFGTAAISRDSLSGPSTDPNQI